MPSKPNVIQYSHLELNCTLQVLKLDIALKLEIPSWCVEIKLVLWTKEPSTMWVQEIRLKLV